MYWIVVIIRKARFIWNRKQGIKREHCDSVQTTLWYSTQSRYARRSCIQTQSSISRITYQTNSNVYAELFGTSCQRKMLRIIRSNLIKVCFSDSWSIITIVIVADNATIDSIYIVPAQRNDNGMKWATRQAVHMNQSIIEV